MLYLIDSGNAQEIEEALMLGARGVTANTSMYRKNDIRLHDFVNGYSNRELDFLSGEVIGTYEISGENRCRIHQESGTAGEAGSNEGGLCRDSIHIVYEITGASVNR